MLSAKDTKSGRPDERPIPSLLAPYIAAWLSKWRSEFRATNDALWLSRKGGALSCAGVQRAITNTTQELLGVAVNPHLFRSCAVTTTAHHAGSKMGMTSALLQHTDARVTEQHYNKGRMVEAAIRFRAIVEEHNRV